MAWLPPQMAGEVANSKALRQYQRFVPGEYILLIKNVEYEEVTTQKGVKEHAIVCRQVCVDSKPHPKGQPPNITPNAVGEQVDYFIPDWGDAKVYTKPKLKSWVLGLIGRDEKGVDASKLAETIGLIGGERQLARGMYIRTIVTASVKQNEDGESYMNHEWLPVAGENDPTAPSVIARRKEIESNTDAGVAAAAASATAGNVPALPGNGIPALPGGGIPSLPAANPMDGWSPHPSDPSFFYRGDKTKKGVYKQAEIVAGQFTREASS